MRGRDAQPVEAVALGAGSARHGGGHRTGRCGGGDHTVPPGFPQAAERRIQFGLYVLVHLVDLAGCRRIVLDERLAQADCAERLGVRIQQAPAVGRDNLGAAAADIDDQDALVALRPNALHSQMNQPRLFAPRDDFHRRAHRFRRACQKFALIAGVANRAGGHHADAHHVELAIRDGHPRQHSAGGLQCLLVDGAAAEDALTQARDFPV